MTDELIEGFSNESLAKVMLKGVKLVDPASIDLGIEAIVSSLRRCGIDCNSDGTLGDITLFKFLKTDFDPFFDTTGIDYIRLYSNENVAVLTIARDGIPDMPDLCTQCHHYEKRRNQPICSECGGVAIENPRKIELRILYMPGRWRSNPDILFAEDPGLYQETGRELLDKCMAWIGIHKDIMERIAKSTNGKTKISWDKGLTILARPVETDDAVQIIIPDGLREALSQPFVAWDASTREFLRKSRNVWAHAPHRRVARDTISVRTQGKVENYTAIDIQQETVEMYDAIFGEVLRNIARFQILTSTSRIQITNEGVDGLLDAMHELDSQSGAIPKICRCGNQASPKDGHCKHCRPT